MKLRISKFCPRCRRTKLREHFTLDRGNIDGRHGWCRRCLYSNQRDRREIATDIDQLVDYFDVDAMAREALRELTE